MEQITGTATTDTKTAKGKRGVKGTLGGLFTKKARKIWIVAGMFVLLVVTGWLNFTMNNSSRQVGGGVQAETNLFALYRITRTNERAASEVVYQSMIGNQNYSTEAQANASAALLELQLNKEFEINAESQILLMLGFGDTVVSRSNGNVNVLIKHETNITRLQAAKIMEILQSIDPDLDIDNVFVSVV